MTDLLKTLLDRDVDREIHGKHPLLKMRYDRNVREAYLYALCLAAIADDGKFAEREEWAIKRVGIALAMPRMDVAAALEDVGRLGEDGQLQLLDEVSETFAGKSECVYMLLVEFSKIWMCGNGRIEDIDGWRKLISEKCGCHYDETQFKNGDERIWTYVDILSTDSFVGFLAKYKDYFALFDTCKMPCLVGHVVKVDNRSVKVNEIDTCDVEGQYKVLRRLASRKWPKVDFLLPCDLGKMRDDVVAEGVRSVDLKKLVDYLDELRYLHCWIYNGGTWTFVKMLTFLCAYAGEIKNEDDLLLLHVLIHHAGDYYCNAPGLNYSNNCNVLGHIACGHLDELEKSVLYGFKQFRKEARKKATLHDMQREMGKRMLEEC